MPTLAMGECGSGKTYWLQGQVARAVRSADWSGARFVVLDTAGVGFRERGDWPGEPARGAPRIRVARCHPRQVGGLLERGERYIIARPDAADRADAPLAPWSLVGDELARVCGMAGRVVLVLPEAQMVCVEGRPTPHHVAELLHAYRHAECDLWLDNQQCAYIRKEVVRACDTVAWFCAGRLDQQACGSLYGADAQAALERVSTHTEPGWHVLITRRPPSVVVVDPRGCLR